MDALIVYPDNKEQLATLKVVMKAMKITFQQESKIYPDHVVEVIKQSFKQAGESQLTPYTGVKDMLNIK